MKAKQSIAKLLAGLHLLYQFRESHKYDCVLAVLE